MSAIQERPQGLTLSSVADSHLGEGSGPFLPDAGPASQDVYREIGNETLTHPFLATLFWHAFVRTRAYGATLADLGVHHSMFGDDQVVVPHGDGSRYDLVVLAPGAPEARGAPIIPGPSDINEAVLGSPGVLQSFARLSGARGRADLDFGALALLAEAAREAAEAGRFGLTVAPAPGRVLLSEVPDPAAAVLDGTGALLASVGLFERRSTGTVATTALHAVGTRSHVTVGSAVGKVVSRDSVTDSCLLEFAVDPFAGSRGGFAGPSATRPPRQFVSVEFDGSGSGRRVTSVLQGFDLSILDPQPYLATKVYTGPDTMPGDSGAALVDPATGEALGLAVYRSSASAAVTFSAWNWAEQVCAFHAI